MANIYKKIPDILKTTGISFLSSAASLSILVTSIRMFLVVDVTVVNAELIIGGKDIVFCSESNIIGTFLTFSITEP